MYELESTLSGHSISVRSVSVFADGKRVVSESIDGTVKIWDMSEEMLGAELCTLSGHSSMHSSISGISTQTEDSVYVSEKSTKSIEFADQDSEKSNYGEIINKENIFISTPTLYDNDKSKYMYPNEARLNNYTYRSSIFCNIGVKYIILDSDKLIVKNFEKVNIGLIYN